MNGLLIGIFLLLYGISSFFPKSKIKIGVRFRGAIYFLFLFINGMALLILNANEICDYLSMLATSNLRLSDGVLLFVPILYIKELFDSIYDIINN